MTNNFGFKILSIGFFLFLPLTICSCFDEGANWQHYRISALTEAKDRNWTIFLHFHQPGNQTCEKQKEILNAALEDKKFKGVGAYRVIFGTEKGLEKMFHVDAPCTLVVLKGDQERGRALDETDPRLLKTVLEQGL